MFGLTINTTEELDSVLDAFDDNQHLLLNSTLSGYLTDKLDELGFDKIEYLIPYQYIDGPDHGKRKDKGHVYDKRLGANGLEGQLQALQDRYYTYMKERHEDLLG